MTRRSLFVSFLTALGLAALPKPVWPPVKKPVLVDTFFLKKGSDGELHIEHQNRVYDTLHQQVFS